MTNSQVTLCIGVYTELHPNYRLTRSNGPVDDDDNPIVQLSFGLLETSSGSSGLTRVYT